MKNIPENNLAYPILIKNENGGSWSGFFLIANQKQYLVTARHVLFDENWVTRWSSIELICQTEQLGDTKKRFIIDLNRIKMLGHPTSDVGIIEIWKVINEPQSDKFSIQFYDGVSLVEGAEFASVTVMATATKPLKDVLISNDVFVYGYPSSLWLKASPQFDYDKPLLRKGIVANIYEKNGTIILDCPIYYGNSWGPVVEVEQDWGIISHKVIGVVIQFVPFEEKWINPVNGLVNVERSNSWYSVAVSMDKVFELIK